MRFAFALCCAMAAGLAQAAPDPLVGARLSFSSETGEQYEVRIDSVEVDPADSEGDTYLYGLSVLDEASQTWSNPCLPDHDGLRKALVLSGHWDASGRHHASDQLTFSCTSGVLGKCVRWGYKPWKDAPGQPMRALHQACTRMTRADYCGDGRSHTREGTPINVYDAFGIQTRDEVDGMTFEAAWGPDGAIAIAHGRYADAERIIAECPGKLSRRERGTATLRELKRDYPEALLFNESRPLP